MLFYLKFFLKRPNLAYFLFPYYNIPRKIRELQCNAMSIDKIIIITYQEKLGNYNWICSVWQYKTIITYQEKLGNYNTRFISAVSNLIITYQEKLVNHFYHFYLKSQMSGFLLNYLSFQIDI